LSIRSCKQLKLFKVCKSNYFFLQKKIKYFWKDAEKKGLNKKEKHFKIAKKMQTSYFLERLTDFTD